MCCIFGFVKWSLNCVQRTLTFIMGFWVLLMVLYAMALALGAGVAFGYDYYLVQHTDRASTKSNVKLGEYIPVMLKKRSAKLSDVTLDDDEITTEASKALLQLVAYVPDWLYKGTPKNRDLHAKPSRITQKLWSITRTTRATRKKIFKKPKPTKKNFNLNKKIKSKKTSTITKKALKLSTVSLTPIPRRKKVVLRTSKPTVFQASTTKSLTTSERSTSPSHQGTVSLTHLPKRTKMVLRTSKPTQNRTSFQASRTKSLSTSERPTSPLHQNVIKIVVPKAPFFKWRSTRPEKFYFKSNSSANYVRKKMKEVLYQPEMQMRKPVSSYGKRKGLPMRHWPVSTKTTEPYTTIEENYRNVIYF